MSEGPTSDPKPLAKTPQGEKPKTLEQVVREQAPDVFSSLPHKIRSQFARVSVKYEERVSVVRSGPLPEASQLAAYNQVIPNGADRIMKMAEDQAAHRIQLEKTVVDSQQRQASRGQVFGLIIGIAGLTLATYAAVHGQPTFGEIIGGTTVGGLVSAFLFSQSRQREELAAKAKQMQSVQPTEPPKGPEK
jgi:uncharacterized membrane protein